MALTGRVDGRALGCQSGLVVRVSELAQRFAQLTHHFGSPAPVDGLALLGERAAISGYARRGDLSVGGATRLLRAKDGWVAVALPRTEDRELLPAWLGVDDVGDPDEQWEGVQRVVRTSSAASIVDFGAALGLAVSRLGERNGTDQPAPRARFGTSRPVVALRNLRVVDLSSLWAGPLCSQLLAGAGLNVIKVESTRRPDGARSGPQGFFDLLNQGKSSVALDFGAREDLSVLQRLLHSADIVIEASRPRALEHLGCGAEEMMRSSGTTIWLSITGHGRGADHRNRVGFGDDAAVSAGLVAYDDSGPVFCADAVTDPITGLLGAVTALELLASGDRWLVDLSLARTASWVANGKQLRWTGDVAPPRSRPIQGAARPLGADSAEIVSQLGDP